SPLAQYSRSIWSRSSPPSEGPSLQHREPVVTVHHQAHVRRDDGVAAWRRADRTGRPAPYPAGNPVRRIDRDDIAGLWCFRRLHPDRGQARVTGFDKTALASDDALKLLLRRIGAPDIGDRIAPAHIDNP